MWVKIFTGTEEARAVLLPNKPQLLLLGTLRIMLVQTDGNIFAVQDFCTHNKESLSKGLVNYRQEIVCPWHGHCFDLRTGREARQRSADLITYAIREEQDGVFIEVAD